VPARKAAAVAALALFLCAAAALPAFVESALPVGDPRPARVTGVVRLIGTGQFPRLVITAEGRGDVFVDEEEWEKLDGLVGLAVTVRGTVQPYDLAIGIHGHSIRIYAVRDFRVVRVR